MPSIYVNDPQPVPCDVCGDFMGYKYSDMIHHHYTSMHLPDGSYEMGAYDDGNNYYRKSSTPFCYSCNAKLKFKLIRKQQESV